MKIFQSLLVVQLKNLLVFVTFKKMISVVEILMKYFLQYFYLENRYCIFRSVKRQKLYHFYIGLNINGPPQQLLCYKNIYCFFGIRTALVELKTRSDEVADVIVSRSNPVQHCKAVFSTICCSISYYKMQLRLNHSEV